MVEGVVGGLPFELEGGSYVGVDANVEFACDLASEVTLDLHLVEFCVTTTKDMLFVATLTADMRAHIFYNT